MVAVKVGKTPARSHRPLRPKALGTPAKKLNRLIPVPPLSSKEIPEPEVVVTVQEPVQAEEIVEEETTEIVEEELVASEAETVKEEEKEVEDAQPVESDNAPVVALEVDSEDVDVLEEEIDNDFIDLGDLLLEDEEEPTALPEIIEAVQPFQTVYVQEDMTMKALAELHDIQYVCSEPVGFVQVTKPVTLDSEKEVVLRYTYEGGAVIFVTGEEARNTIGIPKGTEGKIAPSEDDEYVVFVQNSAPNKKVYAGTDFLYTEVK